MEERPYPEGDFLEERREVRQSPYYVMNGWKNKESGEEERVQNVGS